jgi:hypothetical protein
MHERKALSLTDSFYPHWPHIDLIVLTSHDGLLPRCLLHNLSYKGSAAMLQTPGAEQRIIIDSLASREGNAH